MNISTPKFSIIIPTFNHAHLISRCLSSIIKQDYNNWEAIVVNNFSEDNTIEVIESFKDNRIRLINFYNNGIIAASRNIGINEAKSEWIRFLDSDDWWYPNKLSACSKYLNTSDFIYHPLDYVYGNGRIQKNTVRQVKNNVFKDLLINGNPIGNSSVVVKKEVLDKIGYLSENKELVAVEDFDCWLRISLITNKFTCIVESLGAYYISGNNISLSIKQIQKRTNVNLKHLENSNISKKEKLKILKRLNYSNANIYYDNKDYKNAFTLYVKAFPFGDILLFSKIFRKIFLSKILSIIKN